MADYSSREEKRQAAKRKKPAKTKKQKKKTPIWKRLILVVFLIGLAGLLGGGGLFAYYAFQAPDLNEEDFIDPIPSEIYDMDQNLIGRVGSENREVVNYEDIPPILEDAILATEDVRFYDHMGVDVIRLGGAVLANLSQGFGAEGASTLTQQVIKQSVLTPEKSLERKAQEAWLAFQLEQEYSKEEIFTMYVNKIYYSDGNYGSKAAVKYYYDKELNELELHEAALIAGMPQRPNAYNPYINPDLAEERRNIVLRLMEQHGKISEQEMKDAQAVDIMEGIVERSEEDREKSVTATEQQYEAFVDHVIDEMDQYGDYNLFTDGLKVYTTLDPDAQVTVENVLNDPSFEFPADMTDGEGNPQRSQAGVTLLDTQSGAIRALGGGRDYGSEGKRGFNFATYINRQPGSTIKPLLDYAPAIENLDWSTAEILTDEPTDFEQAGGEPYSPNNFDNQFLGDMTMREALARSRNITAVTAFQEAGRQEATNFIKGLGLEFDEQCNEGHCLSASLGGVSPGTNTVDMAGAYAAFGNNGVYTEPYAISSIEFRDGSQLDTTPESSVAMKDSTAYMITDMLKEVVENDEYGTGTFAAINGIPVAGKSGTTNYDAATLTANNINPRNAPDSWFVGYTTQYTASVWLGYPTSTNPLTPEERRVSQYIFRDIMAEVSEANTPDFEMPSSVVEVEIEKGSNPPKLASSFTPASQKTTEIFIKGTEPSQVSQQFSAPDLSAPTGLNAEYDEDSNSIRLSWDHSQNNNDNRSVEFDVSVQVDGGSSQDLATTSQNGLNVENAEEGATYVFSVRAVAGDDESSAATVSIQIGAAEEEEAPPEEETEEQPEEEQPEEEQTETEGEEPAEGETEQPETDNPEETPAEGDSETPGNGEGNNNGNGEGSGDGNGGGNEEAPPEGEQPSDEPADTEQPQEESTEDAA